MSGIPYSSPSVQFLDPVTDLPLASGKVYTYLTITTTDKATYSDSALTSANANPIVLDADGRATIFLARDSLYTFKIDRSDATTVRTEDDIGVIGERQTGCVLQNTTDHVLADATATALSFDTELSDTSSFHSNSTNPTRITIPSGMGQAKFTAGVEFDFSGTGERYLEVYKNGAPMSNIFRASAEPPAADPLSFFLETTWFSVIKGDYYELFAFQSSGGSLNTNFTSTYFEVETTG